MRLPGLTNLTLPDIKIGQAVAVPAGTTSAIARIITVSAVSSVRRFRFSLLRPDTWNGTFMMGGGAVVRTLDNQAMKTVPLKPLISIT